MTMTAVPYMVVRLWLKRTATLVADPLSCPITSIAPVSSIGYIRVSSRLRMKVSMTATSTHAMACTNTAWLWRNN